MNEAKGLGGWLLVFLILTALGVLAGLWLNITGLIKLNDFSSPFSLIGVIGILWYGVYAFLLVRLALLKRKIIRPIKIMIAGTPVLNTLSLVFLVILVYLELCTITDFWTIFWRYFNTNAIAGLGGGYVAAIIWYIYFCRSKRVHNTWPFET